MAKPEVILTGFADEGPVSKKAEEQLTLCRALGLSYYSVRFVDVGSGVKNVLKLDKEELKKLRQLNEAFEVKVSSIGSPLGKIKLVDMDDGTSNVFVDFRQYLKNDVRSACRAAHALGAKLIRGFSFYPPKGDDPRPYVGEAAERLGQIAALCEKEDLYFGLEVEANLVGRNGELEAALHKAVGSEHLYLVFDGANIVCQGYSTAATFDQYRKMRAGLGWLHIKDYKHTGKVRWRGHVDEEMLKHFVPADRGDVGHEAILRDLKSRLPALTAKLRRQGIPGFFLDLEPHLRGGGQFGGFSGPDGYGVALRSLCKVLDYVGIAYRLTEYEDLKKA